MIIFVFNFTGWDKLQCFVYNIDIYIYINIICELAVIVVTAVMVCGQIPAFYNEIQVFAIILCLYFLREINFANIILIPIRLSLTIR